MINGIQVVKIKVLAHLCLLLRLVAPLIYNLMSDGKEQREHFTKYVLLCFT